MIGRKGGGDFLAGGVASASNKSGIRGKKTVLVE